tara:strand:+ start:120 stop:449 length:330 start_codon:yes stop_codon:yes gene_type:complete
MGKIIYSAITWVDEDKELGKEYISWLVNEHLPELSLQPGFNSVKRIKLEEMNKNQWQGYQIIMEIEKREDLETYFNSKSRKDAFIQIDKFSNVHHAERFFGELDIYLKK